MQRKYIHPFLHQNIIKWKVWEIHEILFRESMWFPVTLCNMDRSINILNILVTSMILWLEVILGILASAVPEIPFCFHRCQTHQGLDKGPFQISYKFYPFMHQLWKSISIGETKLLYVLGKGKYQLHSSDFLCKKEDNASEFLSPHFLLQRIAMLLLLLKITRYARQISAGHCLERLESHAVS